MENITIKIKDEEFEFAGEVLFKHMRQIEPLSIKVQAGKIGNFDFIINLSEILCISKNKDRITNKIDNLNQKEIAKFTKDFEKVMNTLNVEDSKKK